MYLKLKHNMYKSEDRGVSLIVQTIKSGIGNYCHEQLPKATVLSLLLRGTLRNYCTIFTQQTHGPKTSIKSFRKQQQ